jgi:two-component system response regulator PilR (NtrC family)
MDSARARALIVDDEPDIRELIAITLARMNVDSLEAGTVAEARVLLSTNDFNICLTDMRLPDGSGIELVRTIQSEAPALPVAVITAHGNMDSAVEALKAGAFDFVSKPVDLHVLRALVTSALRTARAPEGQGDGAGAVQTLIGDSSAIAEVRAKVARVAKSQAPAFISGESGTGKELVARMIHDLGPRSSGPFVPVNCGAIAPDLIEGELFGHKKGSFTGAHADRIGLFAAADGGTLFLDEVGDLPLPMQVKLLRAIQEKRVRPVGAQDEVAVDVRIVSATHRALAAMVAGGQFRQDLFYRINVIELAVPPLRERREDIHAFVRYFVERIAATFGESRPVISASALARLESHDYPGNVRELENILERAVALCDGVSLEEDDLGFPSTTPTIESGVHVLSWDGQRLDDYLAMVEISAIESALEEVDGNKSAAARSLGLRLGALRYRMQKLGME